MPKVIIAGSRGISSYHHYSELCLHMQTLINQVLKCEPSEVVSGMCPNSPDMLGLRWAEANNIPVNKMPARWRDRDGVKDPRAGFERNLRMAEYVGKGNWLVTLWDGHSRGTGHMIQTAHRLGLNVWDCRILTRQVAR